MNAIKGIALTCILLIAAGILWFKVGPLRSSRTQMVITEAEVTPQKFDRVWQTSELKLISLNNEIQDSLFNPITLRKSSGNLFVSDFSNMQVKKFSQSGEFLTKIGNGKGRGPGENLLIVDLSVEQDTVYIVDSRTFTLSTFTIDGKYLDGFKLKVRPLRVTKTSAGPVVLAFPSAKLFWQLNNKGRVVHKFGTLIEDQEINALSLDGFLSRNPLGGFIYLPMHASLIYYYDQKRNLQKVARRPDGLHFPGTIDKSTDDRKMLMAPSSKIKARSLSIDQGKLYVTMIVKDEENTSNNSDKPEYDYSIIDTYDLKSGKYIRSIKLPFLTGEAQMMSDTLYLIRNGTVEAYSI